MTSKEINKLWAETYVIGALAFERVHKFAALVAAAEREACAKICDVQIESGALSELEKYRAGFIADVIRARGEMK
jgi:hypothetical protein